MPSDRPGASMSGASVTDWFNIAHFFADELLERWHHSTEAPCSAAFFMGLTDDEYAMWVEGRYQALALSLREREA